jgi:insecticidal toxin complex protein TccC
MSTSLFSRNPTIRVLDNRGLTVRDIAYHCHPDTPDDTDERVTRHQYDARGILARSADPRLHDAGLANFAYFTDLAGSILRSHGTDNGTTVALNDAAGRPFITVSNISTADDGTEDRSQAVTRTWQYEDTSLPGRPVSVTEQVAGKAARITERFVYAGNSDTEKARNLAGQCVSHYDTAGLVQKDSVAITGVPLSVTRRLLKDADNPDAVADWQGANASAWDKLLAGEDEGHTTLTTTYATGAVLTTTDAKGNLQRVAYDVAGQLSSNWLTVKGGGEKAIVKSLTYSAAGQKLREEHGNGMVTTFSYEAETQRLTGIRTERPAGHTSGAKVLQDLRYEYDPVGNVLKVSNDAEEIRFWRNQKVVPENKYVYDSLYQLVSATGREMASAGQQGSSLPSAIVSLPTDSATYTNYTRTYIYDASGNLTQVRHRAPATNNSYTTNISVSDRSNRGVLSTLTESPADVDALFTAGGQQTRLQPGQSLVWTPRSELLKVTPAVRDGSADDSESYRYDAGSQRVLKVSVQKTGNSTQTQRALYLPTLELRSAKSGDTETESLQVVTVGEAGRAQVRVLHWESGRPTGIINDQVRYNYDNLTGSSGLEVDGDGNVISVEEYYPYGGTATWTARSAVEADYKTIRYSCKERDATGLYYYGYRYYQPWAGRWLSADPAGTVDGLNLFRMVRNNPVSMKDNDGLIGRRVSLRFASDDAQLQKGNITPLRNRGLFVGSSSAETTLPFVINRFDSVDQNPEPREYSPQLLKSGGALYGAIDVFRGSQVSSSESGSGTIGTHWGPKTLSDNLTAINVVNGMSGSVGIRIRMDDIEEGEPIIITSGALSGCTMLYAVDREKFYAVHTGQKPGDNDWKTGIQGVRTTQLSLNALSGKHLPITGNHNNDLIDTLSEFENTAITYLGKQGTRIDQIRENVSIFDYNQTQAPQFAIRAGYSYALLARHAGKVNVKVLSEDITINSANNKISVLNSMKTRLH